ncbi:MAG: Fic family protein [Clostridiaceae bacterium]
MGDYKKLPNEVGGENTTPPKEVQKQISTLFKKYNAVKKKSLLELIDFHYRFESIHPFLDILYSVFLKVLNYYSVPYNIKRVGGE